MRIYSAMAGPAAVGHATSSRLAAHDKILRLARTIADLDNAESITPAHISEAINYRTLDRNLWS